MLGDGMILQSPLISLEPHFILISFSHVFILYGHTELSKLIFCQTDLSLSYFLDFSQNIFLPIMPPFVSLFGYRVSTFLKYPAQRSPLL